MGVVGVDVLTVTGRPFLVVIARLDSIKRCWPIGIVKEAFPQLVNFVFLIFVDIFNLAIDTANLRLLGVLKVSRLANVEIDKEFLAVILGVRDPHPLDAPVFERVAFLASKGSLF
jgi:hypothetical protein